METLRIGTMPNLQIEIYNKAVEITEISGKDWFPVVWKWDERHPGVPVADVWRIECRFGSEFLKNRNLRIVPDVLGGLDAAKTDNLSRLIAGALVDRRMTVGDETRIRNRAMHPLWRAAWEASGGATVTPAIGRLTSKRREALLKILRSSVGGTLRAASVAEDGAFDVATACRLSDEAVKHAVGDPLHDKKIERAMERYKNILEPDDAT